MGTPLARMHLAICRICASCAALGLGAWPPFGAYCRHACWAALNLAWSPFGTKNESFPLLGSGKLVMPCDRMHWAYLIPASGSCDGVELGLAVTDPVLATEGTAEFLAFDELVCRFYESEPRTTATVEFLEHCDEARFARSGDDGAVLAQAAGTLIAGWEGADE